MKRNSLLTNCLLLFVAFSQMNAQPAGYKYKRVIEVTGQGWYSIPLPNEMFAKLKPDLSDIRIVGMASGGKFSELPFMTEAATEKRIQQNIACNSIGKAQRQGAWYFTIQPTVDSQVNQLQVHFSKSKYDFEVGVEGSNDLQQWFSIASHYRLFKSAEESGTGRNTVEIPDSRFRYFRLAFIGREEPAIDSVSVRLQKLLPGIYRRYQTLLLKQQVDSKRKQTIAEVDLGMLLPVSSVRVWIKPGTVYARPVSIAYAADSALQEGQWQPRYFTVANGEVRHSDSNVFRFDDVYASKLRLAIENADNPALEVDSVMAQGHLQLLTVRFDGPGTYWLYYGNTKATRPQYDIQLLREEAPAFLPQLNPGKQEMNEAKDSGQGKMPRQKVLLWVVMLVAVVSLGLFAFRMMHKGPGNVS